MFAACGGVGIDGSCRWSATIPYEAPPQGESYLSKLINNGRPSIKAARFADDFKIAAITAFSPIIDPHPEL